MATTRRAASLCLINYAREWPQFPGVRAVGTSELGTLTGSDMGSNITAEGSKDLSADDSHVNFDPISPAISQRMGVPLLAGREFTDGDGPGKTK